MRNGIERFIHRGIAADLNQPHLQHGILLEPIARLLTTNNVKQRAEWNAKRAGLLRPVVTGGQWAQARLHRAKLVEHPF